MRRFGNDRLRRSESEAKETVIRSIVLCGVLITLFISCASFVTRRHPLADRVVCIDPGHGGTAAFDSYRVGPAGEREEWIDLRVAIALKEMLEVRGARVLMTRTEDVDVPLKDRAFLAVTGGADVFLSIHHNATADSSVNFPIIYFHGNASENRASVQLGRLVARRLSEALFDGHTPLSLVSDHTIFPEAGTAVLRHSYGIPGIIGEASFFTHPDEEERLKDDAYNRKEAAAYVMALEEFFSHRIPPIHEKYSNGRIPPFAVFQEAERMDPVARRWKDDFYEGERLFQEGHTETLQHAYDLFTRSAKSFPDSWVAGKCHLYRWKILRLLNKTEEADLERKRVEEYYIDLK